MPCLCIHSVVMLPLLSLVSDKMDMEILSEIANNDALIVTKESNGYVVTLTARMQEAGPMDMEKVRFYSPCIKCTGKTVTLCIK